MCKKCPGPDACGDRPTAELPLELDCPVCNGAGCRDCDDGKAAIDRCPLELLDRLLLEFLQYARLFVEHGLAPVAGGVLDQAAGFVAGAGFVADELAYWKAKHGVPYL